MTRVLYQDLEYVDVRTSDRHEPANFYEKCIDQPSANPELISVDVLRKMYPGYSLLVSDDDRLANLSELPGITIRPEDSNGPGAVLNVAFSPTSRRVGSKAAGSLVNSDILGSYHVTWNASFSALSWSIADWYRHQECDFIVHVTKHQYGNVIKTVRFILHNGPEQRVRDLVLAVCLYTEQARDEIWVFNQGRWSKDKILWNDIKDSSWDNIVMKEETKKALQNDIYGFFNSEVMYKELAIPWKRGLIMYGPSGNGKTISIKAIMKTCTERGFTPLYVKSFHSLEGDETSMQAVFLKARQLSPCVLVLEDLDSLITNGNRSFFLNQLDGLEGNDGLLVIASTNHINKLNLGLSSRPGRFDRKYLFNDPDRQERELYARYWQDKLKHNEMSFPDSLVEEVTNLTEGFSFAYLKEAFVSALVQTTNATGEEWVAFHIVLGTQIMALRQELGKPNSALCPTRAETPSSYGRMMNGAKQRFQSLDVPPSLDPGQPTLPATVSSTQLNVSNNASPPVVPVAPGQKATNNETPMVNSEAFRQHFSRSLVVPPSVGAGQPTLLATVSPTQLDMSDKALLPVAQTTHKAPERANTVTSTSSRLLPQGYYNVLPAPPSAYPQVVPDSLSFKSSDPLSAIVQASAPGQRESNIA